MTLTPDKTKRRDAIAMGFAIFFPTLVTLVYFQWLRNSETWIQQSAYGLGKTLQFGFPVAYVWLFYRGKLFSRRQPAPNIGNVSANNLVYAVAFALAVCAAMFAIYFLIFDGTAVAANLQSMVAEKISSMGLNTFWKYAALGVFYAICHSFLEEYYWRWFVFDMLRNLLGGLPANILSSLGFMAHHVVLLGFFFGFNSPLTYLFSLAVAIGGSFWAWLYGRQDNLLGAWISHMIVDAGIFSLGYFLVRETVLGG